jgi:hypothetical protein
MKKKAAALICTIMTVTSLVACSKTSPEKAWSGAYINDDGMILVLSEDGSGYLNDGYGSNLEIEWEIDDEEISFEADNGMDFTIDIEDKEPGDRITVKGSDKSSDKFKRVEIYEEK